MLKCQCWRHWVLTFTICFPCVMCTSKLEKGPQHQISSYFSELLCVHILNLLSDRPSYIMIRIMGWK
jgi:hypothetical protein